MTNEFRLTLIWLLAGTAGVFMAMNAVGGSFNGSEYLPVSNDSFYHARRILDAVADPSAFFEFDDRIHVPEGSWVPWPWLYDFMVSKIVLAVMFISGAKDPVPILAHVPVFWVYINVLLVILVARQLGFGYLPTLLAGLGVALSPLMQAVHGTGVVDHHYVELTFVLMTTLGGLRWFADPKSMAKGAFVGLVLGAAPGFHNGLFILQIPVLCAFYLCWFRGMSWALPSVGALAVAMCASTSIVLLGSESFWQGVFVYYRLSFFHLYAAVCTSVLMLLAANRTFSWRRLYGCAAVAVLMFLPILGDAVSMGAFLHKDIARFEVISETESVIAAIIRKPGPYLLNYFTIFVFLTPVIYLAFCRTALKAVTAQWVFFSLMGLFCLTLLFSQLRFQYFGVLFLAITPLLLARWWAAGKAAWPIWLSIGLVAFYGAAYAKPVMHRIEQNWPLGLDDQYRLVHDLLPELKKLCEEDPGVVLAYNDLGNYIRYHTDCSVVANNFLLTRQHEEKIAELDDLLGLEIEELAAHRPDIKYLLLAFPSLYLRRDDGGYTAMSRQEVAQFNSAWPLMFTILLVDDYGAGRLELLREKKMKSGDDEFAVVKLLRIRPIDRAEKK